MVCEILLLQDIDGNTILHLAAKGGYTSIFKTLQRTHKLYRHTANKTHKITIERALHLTNNDGKSPITLLNDSKKNLPFLAQWFSELPKPESVSATSNSNDNPPPPPGGASLTIHPQPLSISRPVNTGNGTHVNPSVNPTSGNPPGCNSFFLSM